MIKNIQTKPTIDEYTVLTNKQMQQIFKLSISTLNTLREAGLPFIQTGQRREVYFYIDDLKLYLKNNNPDNTEIDNYKFIGEKFLNLTDLAKMYNFKRETFHYLQFDKPFRSIMFRLGRKWYVRKFDFEEWAIENWKNYKPVINY